MKTENLRDLLALKVNALRDVEEQILAALPAMIEKATDEDLKASLRDHFEETRLHAKRLEDALDELGEEKSKIKSDGIRGIVKDAEWSMKHAATPEALDAAIIASASYVEHYEIAGYTAAIAWADTLGLDAVSEILSETLKEEHHADAVLQESAHSKVNQRAAELV
jgi:ferritin-like metal-binding protein YciE